MMKTTRAHKFLAALLLTVACATAEAPPTESVVQPVPLAVVQAEVNMNPKALERIKDRAAFERALQMIPSAQARRDVLNALSGGPVNVQFAPGSKLQKEFDRALGR